MSTTVPAVRRGVGERLPRSDGRAKVTGAFAYASDLRADHMLWGVTLRSPHASARLRAIDTRAARALEGVRAVLTHADVPGAKCIGVSHLQDQPVLAFDRVRHHGEPVAVVAAEDLATARRAAALIAVDYEPLPLLGSVEAALAPDAPALHPDGNTVRAVRIVHGDPDAPLPADAVNVRRDLRGRHAGPGVPRSGGRARAARSATAASSSRSRRSGCTRTASRSRRRSGCPRSRCGSCWPASAARSAAARTSRCTCTPACSRSPPGAR